MQALDWRWPTPRIGQRLLRVAHNLHECQTKAPALAGRGESEAQNLAQIISQTDIAGSGETIGNFAYHSSI